MLFVASGDGQLLHGSGALIEVLGPLEGQGMMLLELAHPEDRAVLGTAWAKLVETGEPMQTALRLRDAEATYQPLSCKARRSRHGDQIFGVLEPGDRIAAEELAPLRLKARIIDSIVEHVNIVTIWAIKGDGTCVLHEGRVLEKMGMKPGQLLGLNIIELYADHPDNQYLKRALAGEIHRIQPKVGGVNWDTWFVPLRDDGGAGDGVLGVSFDISESKRVEEELRVRLEQVEQQQQLIRDLSTPIIEVWDGVLTLPLVGMIDNQRTAEVMDHLLSRIVEKKARFAILDLTGVKVVDTTVASHLLGLVSAIRLLGAEGIVAGIKPEVAHTMVSLGLDLSQLTTQRNLRAALSYAIQQMERIRPGLV